MPQSFDSKGYTKLRDIAQKRMKRAVTQGLLSPIHFPTVREIKSGIVDPQMAFRALKNYVSGGSTVTAIKQTGLKPDFREFPQLPPRQKMTDEERRQRKRETNRRSRQRQRMRSEGFSEYEVKKGLAYIKGAITHAEKLAAKGRGLSFDFAHMSAADAAAFAAYMDYRFAQGDFTKKYVIDEFVEDFDALVSHGHKPADIVKDFDNFLANQDAVKGRADSMEGMSYLEFTSSWRHFVG